jgi:Xaa-Pro aminopeptidase
MKNYSCDKGKALLLTDRLTRKYFCGCDVAEGILVITDKFTVFTDARYFSAAKVIFKNAGIDAVLYKGLATVQTYLEQNGIKELKVDYSKTTVKEFLEYEKFGVTISDCSGVIEGLKAVKTESELNSIKTACRIVEKACAEVLKTVKKGITETELKDKLENLMIEYGAEGPSFDTIVAFGPNAAVPHHETGNTALKDNSVILIDAGCKIDGYCSDITRTAFFGTPSEEFVKCYNAVKLANEKAIENITDGMIACDADGIARQVLNECGLGEYFTHSLGHGVGQEIHEFPTLSVKGKAELKNGMVFTIEPGVYIDCKFGIRIEDTVVLKDGKVARLYSDDKDLLIL